MLITVPFSLLLGFLLVAFSVYAGKTTQPNAAIGIRTKATMASQLAWIAGHRAAKPWIFAAGISLVLISVTAQLAAIMKINEDLGEYIALSGIFASIVILAIGAIVSNKEALKV